MGKQNSDFARNTVGLVMIWIGIFFLVVHALFKIVADISDWQHWGVLLSAALILFGGYWGMGKRG